MGKKMKHRKRRLHYKNRGKRIWINPELEKPYISAITMLDAREIDMGAVNRMSFLELVKKAWK
jgi:hypothetical protein